MIIIQRNTNWYRPYCYDKYIIASIKFYDEKGIVIENGNGWLENRGKDLNFIKLDINEVLLKRKEDFSIKGAFMISKGKDMYKDELRADLYINVNLVNLHFTEYKKEYDSIRAYYVGNDYDNQKFEVSIIKKWLKDDWYEYGTKIEEIGKKLTSIYTDITIDEYKKYIDDLKKYGTKLFKAKQKYTLYSVEDYKKEIGEI